MMVGFYFGIDDVVVVFCRYCQWFFVEYWFIGGDGGQGVFFVGWVSGGDQDGIDIVGVNYVVIVGVDFCLYVWQCDCCVGVVGIDIRYCYNGGVLQNLGVVMDVFFIDSVSVDDI